ncbi:alpha/beta fold hydrolase [Amycolatopsis methanolica]|uniref:alpha/beta fold hydrolase n=1 Tax=Amycolatopsis methanolica TaxID=1814 RepID=UPI00342F497F
MPAAGPGRKLAPDLIGMGESAKPDIGYTFDDHARCLDAWFQHLGLDDVVLVGHDWGVAVTETIVKPMSWEEFPPAGAEIFQALKTPGVGEKMMLDDNIFLESMALADEDRAAYLRPYPARESRVPLLTWARSMPLGGEPADVVERVEHYDMWLAASVDVPKLLMTFGPGFDTMMDDRMIAWCAEHIAALDIVHHDLPAGHHTPEDQPEALAATLAAWLDAH